jgi:hypothetical protein
MALALMPIGGNHGTRRPALANTRDTWRFSREGAQSSKNGCYLKALLRRLVEGHKWLGIW